jgi:hypothetical protein
VNELPDSTPFVDANRLATGEKIFLIVAIVLAVAILLLDPLRDFYRQPAKPKFNARISREDAGIWRGSAVFTLTLLSAKSAVVRRIVFNARNGENDCDLRPLKRMEMGDTLKISWPEACGKAVRVEIDTDRGVVLLH